MAKKREFNPEEEAKGAKDEIKELETLQKELKEEKKVEAKTPSSPRRNCI